MDRLAFIVDGMLAHKLDGLVSYLEDKVALVPRFSGPQGFQEQRNQLLEEQWEGTRFQLFTIGDFLEPLGTLKADELGDAFARQAEALLAGGADGLLIETMTALDEMTIAVEAAKSAGAGVPVLASMCFDKAGESFRTMMGVGLEDAAEKLVSLGVDAIGFNCGTATLDEYVVLAENLVSAVRELSDDVIVFAEPNAGKPQQVEGEVLYKVSPDEFVAAAESILSVGVGMIGGCCGTSPAHIEAVAKRIRKTA